MRMEKVALVIIYNHKFDQNIEILESLYQGKFSHIYHLVPFYTGNKENVIPVYENSHYFQGYVAQGLKLFYKKEYKHYLFVADDMVINPIINELNYQQHFKLNDDTSFLPGFVNLHDCNKGERIWFHATEAFKFKLDATIGIETKNEYPDYKTALQAFEKNGLKIEPFNYRQFNTPVKKPRKLIWGEIKPYLYWKLKSFKNRSMLFNLNYPIVGSYSDIFIVSSEVIHSFAHYCGVFATNKLFVEFAIPTAMVLAAKEIVTEEDLQLHGRPLWSAEELMLLDKYDFSVKKLVSDFPKGLLYLHPVKLSKWK